MRTFLLFFIFIFSNVIAEVDPLPSWSEGNVKTTLLKYVRDTTNKDGPDYIPPKERLATFDNDGTLWVEQPAYTEQTFAYDRISALAPEHPEWQTKEPFKSILDGNTEKINKFTEAEVAAIVIATHSGMDLDDFHQIVRDWLNKAIHPRFKRPYTELTYQPMQELINFLKSNNFEVYIVSGGGQEFMRAFTEKVYGIPPQKVIGTAGHTEYAKKDGKPMLIKDPKLLFIDDHKGKPEGINLIIGQRPIAAFGNSTGDQQMLEWTQANKAKHLELLVHHDDAVREYAYGPESKIGTFSAELMEEAKKQGWLIVSMKNDWKVIFSNQ